MRFQRNSMVAENRIDEALIAAISEIAIPSEKDLVNSIQRFIDECGEKDYEELAENFIRDCTDFQELETRFTEEIAGLIDFNIKIECKVKLKEA